MSSFVFFLILAVVGAALTIGGNRLKGGMLKLVISLGVLVMLFAVYGMFTALI